MIENVDITMSFLPPMTGNGLLIPTLYGDDWGMVYDCYTHITMDFVIFIHP